MSIRIDIVNIALSMLGSKAITSIEDDSTEARVMKTNYIIARDATIEAYEWSFAIKRFTPAKSTEPPIWGFGSAFPIPSDILRVLQVDLDSLRPSTSRNTREHRNQVYHVVESGSILCDEDNIFCTGLRRVDDEGIFSNLFAHAFAAKLAVLCCYAITESNTKFRAVLAMYTGFIKEAKSRDGQQGSTRRLRGDWFRRVR